MTFLSIAAPGCRVLRVAVLAVLLGLLATVAAARAEEPPRIGLFPGEAGPRAVAAMPVDAFAPFRNGANLGFRAEPVWLRVEVAPAAPGDPRYLVIRPIYTDRIEVYRAADPGAPILVAGDAVNAPLSQQFDGYTVLLPASAGPETYLVRLQTQNLLQPQVDIRRLEDLQRGNLRLVVSVAVAVAATGFYLLWAISAMALDPSPLMAAYILRLAMFVLTLVVHSGALRVLTHAEITPAQDQMHNATALAYMTMAQVFDYLLLRERGRTRLLTLFGAAVVVLSAAKGALFLSGQVSGALQLNNLSALVTLALGLAAAGWSARGARSALSISRASIIGYFLLQAVPLAVLMLAGLVSARPLGPLMDLVFLNYAIVPGAYVTYLLFRRQQQITRQRAKLETRALLLRTEAAAEAQKRAQMGDLLRMLTHEVKTPLSTLQMAQTLGVLDAQTLDTAIGTIDHVLQQCDRVEEIEGGGLLVCPVEIDLAEALQRAARAAGVALILPEAPGVSVRADGNLLQIVLTNLLNNADKYRAAGRPIEARIDSGAQGVTLAISNAVPARAMPDPQKMFEKYYRHRSALARPGTGLGLYIVRQLCRRMDVGTEAVAAAGRVTLRLTFPPPA